MTDTTHESADMPKLPSAARCNRVSQILLKEPAFHDLIGTVTVDIQRRDGVIEKYPDSVVEVAARLAAQRLDANTATRDEILDVAKVYFASLAPKTASVAGAPEVPASVTMTADSDMNALADGAALAVYSLLLSAKALGENDRKPGAATRLLAIKKALEIYRPCIASIAVTRPVQQ